MKRKITVIYRGEFKATVIAKGNSFEELQEDAKKKFEKSKKIEITGSTLWPEYLSFCFWDKED